MNRIFSSWTAVTGLFAAALVILLCFGLPLFVPALQPFGVRAVIALVVIGIWIVLVMVRQRQARRASDEIAAELSGASGAQEEAVVTQRMRDAIASFKQASGGARDYLYSRPWYVIIGPPGAGKTTALLNSGLRFPFADQSLKGIGGTRNLDFWFADEAAIVDTAGRYTSQDSDASADSQGWRSLLAQLRRNRPKQPINGVIVAIGVDELLKADLAGIDRHATSVRRRLSELRAALDVDTPVYLLLTKADLLAGFVEFYDDLEVEGRRAVLGVTLPDPDTRPAQNAIVAAFDRMVSAQGARQAKRLKEEADATRRSLILGYPSQLAALRSRLARFMEGAFASGEAAGTLRGFYFTSGVQEGAPLDRILSGVAEIYDAAPAQTGQSGRTYFLNRLLREVVFREAGLVQTGRAAREKQRRQLIGALAAVAIFTVIGVVLIVMSAKGA
ncbi:type VI secretion system membrane subunit TssM [Novosphingobium tardum]|uniref:Type VI secretion system membrane subunit TssM n=1 Tax=Novosphingobium tardum TaxID=1538021 RepID=A0ABV8RQ03_9SPHN